VSGDFCISSFNSVPEKIKMGRNGEYAEAGDAFGWEHFSSRTHTPHSSVLPNLTNLHSEIRFHSSNQEHSVQYHKLLLLLVRLVRSSLFALPQNYFCPSATVDGHVNGSHE
jgi:hypothetical protein